MDQTRLLQDFNLVQPSQELGFGCLNPKLGMHCATLCSNMSRRANVSLERQGRQRQLACRSRQHLATRRLSVLVQE